jgi:hypothetical protein
MRTIRFRDTSIQFPDACAVCLNRPRHEVEFERTFIFGRRSRRVKLLVPLCSEHTRLARHKSILRTLCERLAAVGGIFLALAAAVRLFTYWLQTGQGNPFWTVPLALFVGSSLGVTFWAAISFWVSPFLDRKETIVIRKSVRMTRYDPYRNLLDVRFTDDTFAELTARHNLSLLDIDAAGLKHYYLTAAIHSDDIRLNGSLETDVLLDHLPTEREAVDLLDPPARALMARNLGAGCFYDIFVTGIREIPPPAPPVPRTLRE